jgi:hypothetical protein
LEILFSNNFFWMFWFLIFLDLLKKLVPKFKSFTQMLFISRCLECLIFLYTYRIPYDKYILHVSGLNWSINSIKNSNIRGPNHLSIICLDKKWAICFLSNDQKIFNVLDIVFQRDASIDWFSQDNFCSNWWSIRNMTHVKLFIEF